MARYKICTTLYVCIFSKIIFLRLTQLDFSLLYKCFCLFFYFFFFLGRGVPLQLILQISSNIEIGTTIIVIVKIRDVRAHRQKTLKITKNTENAKSKKKCQFWAKNKRKSINFGNKKHWNQLKIWTLTSLKGELCDCNLLLRSQSVILHKNAYFNNLGETLILYLWFVYNLVQYIGPW